MLIARVRAGRRVDQLSALRDPPEEPPNVVRASSDSSIVTIDMKGSIAALRASSADPLANLSPARRCM